ncbi:hypothetical protein KVV02_001645 [Mortierella alpina]|uniref:Uncharacterized protein n=1 Tax=Mortierella alpina TaxID=64518 RepID=A0A9P8D123_MORAP|nr:hypothetical protein KVV02_001645 [Mortierella alpina]
MEIEMVCYWRSDEGSEPPLHEELAAPIDIEMGDVADQRKMTAAPDSTPGFGLGLVLQEHLELGGDLTVILVMDCLTIIVYLWAIHSSQKKVHRRMGRIFFRLVMSVLILYGPAKVLHGCWYTVERRYDPRPGVNFAGEIHCPADTHYADLGTGVLFYYHLLRARCIITLTLAMLVVLEMAAYMRSAEGRRSPQDVELAAPIDIGMGTTTSHQANNTNMTSAAVPAPILTDADADTLPTYSPLILGIVLRGRTDLYYDLIIIIVSDALAFIMYTMAIRRSKNNDHSRLLGIGLRIAMSIFTLFVPAKALNDCRFGVEQLWSVSRGPYYSETIRCPGLSLVTYEEGERLRPTYDLLRALCIVALIVSLLMVVELFSYWWSFIIGMVLISNFEFPDKLPLMLITDALTVIFYARFTYGSKRARQYKALHIFLRLVLAFLTVFGPLQALRQCTYRMRRDYYQQEPGIVFFERIDCDDAATILETFFYGWSDEAKGLPQEEAAAATEGTRNDVELANTFILGMILRERLYELESLTHIIVSEALSVVLYSVFLYSSKVQFRPWRILLRLTLVFLMISGSIKAQVNDCKYSSERDYGTHKPGLNVYELINCNEGSASTAGTEQPQLLSVLRQFRARCIISFTLCALMFVELLCYWWSTEGLPRDSALTVETQEDVELGARAFEEPQKMALRDPAHPTTAAGNKIEDSLSGP